MRIVDVSAFYSPLGGGVRTYVEAKLRAAPRFGHEMVVVVPGARDEIEREQGRAARLCEQQLGGLERVREQGGEVLCIVA